MAGTNPQNGESEDSEAPPTKKIKLVDENGEDKCNLQSFRGFKLVKVLNENVQAKNIAVHGEPLVMLRMFFFLV